MRRNEEALDGYAEAMHCHLGDFREYAALRRRDRRRSRRTGAQKRSASRRAEAAVSLEALQGRRRHQDPGRSARRGGPSSSRRHATGKGAPTGPGVVTEDRQFRRLTLVDVPVPVEAAAADHVPKHFNPKSPKARRDLATTHAHRRAARPAPPRRAKERAADEAQESDRIDHLRRELKAHPCHQCPEREDHARWAERW